MKEFNAEALVSKEFEEQFIQEVMTEPSEEAIKQNQIASEMVRKLRGYEWQP